MSWIETIAYEDANTKLKALYDRVKGPDNNVDNICLLYTSPSPRDRTRSRMPSSA